MNALVQYLQDAAVLECQLYSQKRLLNKLSYSAQRLGIPMRCDKPVLRDSPSSFSIVPLLFISFPISLFLWIWIAQNLLQDIKLYEYSIFLTLVFPIIAIMLCIILSCKKIDDIRNKKAQQSIYKRDLEKYYARVEEDNIRVNRELEIKKELEKQIRQLTVAKESTEKSLNSLYDIGIIHRKYRHMVAVSSFYDYFDTGRCTSLTGPGGAYDTYEYEVRFGTIVTKLDIIINKLDEIIANQQMLGDLMRDANNTLYRIEQSNNKMMKSMSRIEQNAELIEYNSRCTMQSSAVMEHIMVYNTLKQN